MFTDKPSPHRGGASPARPAWRTSPRAIDERMPALAIRGLVDLPRPRSSPDSRDALDEREDAVDRRPIDTAGAPAPEALSATQIAAAVVRELRASGREVRFAFVPTRKGVAVLLCDMDGGVLSRLTPARALEIAAGDGLSGAAQLTRRPFGSRSHKNPRERRCAE